MEERIDILEKELEMAKEIILMLCDKVENLEASANKAWALYDKVKNKPMVKAFLK